jgi:acetyl esterase
VADVSAVHPQIQAIADQRVLAADDSEPGPPALEAIRAGYLQTAIELGGPVEPVGDVADVVIPRAGGGRVRARVYTPLAPVASRGLLVWCHGGGWVSGDLEGFDRVARQLANAGGVPCVSVDYRLAPEHPFPAALEDAQAAVTWARGAGAEQLGTDPRLVVAGGDSAGGQLIALALQRTRAPVRTQLLVYPALDPACESEAYRTYADGPMLTRGDMVACWQAYRGALDARSDELSPVAGELAGLPAARIAVAEHDPLRDDGLAYAAALQAAGVAVEILHFETMTHGFLRWGGIVEQARELIDWLGQGVRIALT